MLSPNSSWLQDTVALDDRGFVLTDVTDGLESSRYATDVGGIYAVGDIRSGSVKRVASAVGEGSAVVADIHRYLAAFEEALVRVGTSRMPAGWLDFNPSPTIFGDITEGRLTDAIM